MKFTFGIITDDKNANRLEQIFHSIILTMGGRKDLFEMLIIGNSAMPLDSTYMNIRRISDNFAQGHITKKKNLIIENASFENIVFLHDYITFDRNWYSEFLNFGNNWDVCMNTILNADGTRYRDWCLFPEFCKGKITVDGHLLPYNVANLQKYMYISGAYWVAKKAFMQKYPLDEKLYWGQGEDMEWSERALHNNDTIYKMNPGSTVRLLKQKRVVFTELTNLNIKELKT